MDDSASKIIMYQPHEHRIDLGNRGKSLGHRLTSGEGNTLGMHGSNSDLSGQSIKVIAFLGYFPQIPNSTIHARPVQVFARTLGDGRG